MPTRETQRDLKAEAKRYQDLYGTEKSKNIGLVAQKAALQEQLVDAVEEAQLSRHRIQLMHETHAADIAEAQATIEDQQLTINALTAELNSLRQVREQDLRELKGLKRDYGAISLRTMDLWGQMWCHLATWRGPVGRYAERFLEEAWKNSPEGKKLAARLERPSRGRR